MWLPVPYNYTSNQFTEYLLREAGIVCGSGTCFGEYGEGFVRFSLTVNESRIVEAVQRIKLLFKGRSIMVSV